MGKKILLFTDGFPFGKGESFLESEIQEWGKRNSIELIIFPLLTNAGKKRKLQSNVRVDQNLYKKLHFYEKRIFFLFPIIFLNPFFWKEIVRYPAVFFQFKKLRKLIAASTFSWIAFRYLKTHYLKELNEQTIFYSYWFYYAAYAGALLKRKKFDFTLVTRAHGTDVFQNRKDTGSYIPFRKFPISNYFDAIFPVSEEGKRYLNSNQNIPVSKIQVANLGIQVPDKMANFSVSNQLHVLSCSNLVEVKRVELIVKGLARFKKTHQTIELSWTHIGDGKLKEIIIEQANKALVPLDINFEMLGHLPNTDVFNYYQNNNVDCFVNCSSSEGLPVTIMEALCFGVPVLATSVGGIPEAVSEQTGFLLDKDFSMQEFTEGLYKMLEFKDIEKRETIAKWGRNKFNAELNYNDFINTISSF